MKNQLKAFVLGLTLLIAGALTANPYTYNTQPQQREYKYGYTTGRYQTGYTNPNLNGASSKGSYQGGFYNDRNRIGYQTQYSNGVYTPSVYQYTGTYNPTTAPTGGSGARTPRRVAGYTNDGEYHDDGNPDTWYNEKFSDIGEGYEYYWYGGHWYAVKGNSVYIWTSWAGWWRPWGIGYESDPSVITGQGSIGYNVNQPSPVGDALVPLMFFVICFAVIKYSRRKRVV